MTEKLARLDMEVRGLDGCWMNINPGKCRGLVR